MMTLGFISRRFAPARGGVEQFLLGLARALSREFRVRGLASILSSLPDRPGVDDLFARAYADEDFGSFSVKALCPSTLDRLRLLPCGLRLLPGLRKAAYGPLRDVAVKRFASVYAARTRRYFEDVSVIHSFAFGGPGVLGRRTAERLRVPFVITPFVHPGRWGDSRADVRLYNSADAVIALHEADAEALRALGVHPALIRICGVGVEAVTGDGERFRQKHALTGPVVLFVGRNEPHKGAAELREAVSALGDRGKPLTLVLVGPGRDSAVVDDLKRPDGTRILTFGEIDEIEKQDALAACDLFCLPSDSEIMPVSILEAWQAGKPVLTGDIPALRSFVRDNETGFFTRRNAADIAAHLSDFLDSPGRWAALGRAGQQEVLEHYRIETIASRMRDIYEEVLRRKQEVTRFGMLEKE